jgi:class 3 adenylate cyclase
LGEGVTEPRIQYAQTKDGVSIAFTTVGKGTPLVVAGDISDSHVQLAWDSPPSGPLFQLLAGKHAVVKFDPRGFGLSDRDVSAFSLDSRLLDLEAVVDHLGLTRFTLLGINVGGPLAVLFAAQNPERVSGLVLLGSPVRTAELLDRHRISKLAPLIQTDWEMFLENLAAVNVGYGREDATRTAKLLAASVERETFTKWSTEIAGDDVTSLLEDVRCPTLVLHYTGVHYLTQDMARELTSAIQDSRLVILEGHYGEGHRQTAEAILDFLSEGEDAAAAPGLATDDIHTILFTDVEGSTALTQRLGDAKARELLREHERIVRESLKAHGGSEVKTMGDGFMASFSSATKALECAIAMQREFSKWNQGVGAPHAAPEPIRVRIGLNAGEPIAEDDDLFGTAVNLAARICAHAEAGQILAPIVVRELAAGKQFLFADLGETALRGFEDPVRLYEVSWRES